VGEERNDSIGHLSQHQETNNHEKLKRLKATRVPDNRAFMIHVRDSRAGPNPTMKGINRVGRRNQNNLKSGKNARNIEETGGAALLRKTHCKTTQFAVRENRKGNNPRAADGGAVKKKRPPPHRYQSKRKRLGRHRLVRSEPNREKMEDALIRRYTCPDITG